MVFLQLQHHLVERAGEQANLIILPGGRRITDRQVSLCNQPEFFAQLHNRLCKICGYLIGDKQAEHGEEYKQNIETALAGIQAVCILADPRIRQFQFRGHSLINIIVDVISYVVQTDALSCIQVGGGIRVIVVK